MNPATIETLSWRQRYILSAEIIFIVDRLVGGDFGEYIEAWKEIVTWADAKGSFYWSPPKKSRKLITYWPTKIAPKNMLFVSIIGNYLSYNFNRVRKSHVELRGIISPLWSAEIYSAYNRAADQEFAKDAASSIRLQFQEKVADVLANFATIKGTIVATPDSYALATEIHKTKNYEEMSVLLDSLDEAGSDSAAIASCRTIKRHGPGSWLLHHLLEIK
jgi:hypothetical protein